MLTITIGALLILFGVLIGVLGVATGAPWRPSRIDIYARLSAYFIAKSLARKDFWRHREKAHDWLRGESLIPAKSTQPAPAVVEGSKPVGLISDRQAIQRRRLAVVMGRLSKARKARQRYEGRSCHTAGCYVCRSTLVGLRYHRSPVGDMHAGCASRIKSELKRELSRW